MTRAEKGTYQSIDLAKFIASILVFAMHCNVLSDYKYLSIIPQLLARWGVPFFFICSAYFLFSKSIDGKIEIHNIYIYRIVMLYALWLLYNLPSIVYYRLWSEDIAAISTWLFFIKNSILASTFTGSWYLMSSIFSAWFVYVLSRKFQTKTVIIITSIFYFLCVITSAYQGLICANILKILRFLCFPLNIVYGCFYFAIGKYIAENKDHILRKIDRKKAAYLFVIFYAIFIIEVGLTKHYRINGSTDVTIVTVFMSLFLFLYSLQAKIKIKKAFY